MSKIILGKYVNTHGINGEIRIKSHFKYKDRVFKKGNEIIINDVSYIIKSYRVHKDYDMVTLQGINTINEIPFAKNTFVYIIRENYLDNNDYIDNDLIGFTAYNRYFEVIVKGILYIKEHKKILDCGGKLIPFELIDKIDFVNKKIKIKEVLGL